MVTEQNSGVLALGGRASEEGGSVNKVSFTLSPLPGSVNMIYGPRRTICSQNGWGLRDEWLLWSTKIKPYVLPLPAKVAKDSIVRVDRCYYYPWFTKEGNWRRADTSNMDKLLFDVISQKIGIDDLYFKQGWMDSRDSGNPRVEVTLTEIAKCEWEGQRERLSELLEEGHGLR